MTGATFAKASDETLAEVAAYWSDRAGRSFDDARKALSFLRATFRCLSQSPTALFNGASLLGSRVGLLKQHADRVAAHLSLEPYEFSLLDCAHVVAALVILGEIVVSFDDPRRGTEYFDEIDQASHAAAKHLFPSLYDARLFGEINIAIEARDYWQRDTLDGLRMIIEELPHTMGWP
ncbi:MAG: hypothetical protein WC809_10150 [Sinimarinibacterium sp.]|jgi:hypothetical protein